MTNTSTTKWESAGWGFWLISFVVILGPCILGLWKLKYDDTSWLIPVGMGILITAMLAGFVTWTINAILQKRNEKESRAKRKAAKKKKKK